MTRLGELHQKVSHLTTTDDKDLPVFDLPCQYETPSRLHLWEFPRHTVRMVDWLLVMQTRKLGGPKKKTRVGAGSGDKQPDKMHASRVKTVHDSLVL